MQQLVLSGQFTGRPEQRGAIADLARGMYGPSRAESGCISYACFVQADQPDAYLFFEEWADDAAIDAHFASPHFAGFMERFPNLISGAPVITIYAAAAVTDSEPAPPQAPILVAGRFAGKPDRRTDLLALAKGMFAPSRGEAGCGSYDFFEEIGADGRFLFFERWRDKAAIDEHFTTPHFAAFMRAFPELKEGQLDIRQFAVSSQRTV